MFDAYGNLIATLNNWRTTDGKVRERSRQAIKGIAEKLSEDSTNIEHRLDASFCYYISGYYVHAQVLGNVDFHKAHLIQRWILYFLAKRFSELKVEVSDVVNDTRFQDASIQEGIYASTLDPFDVVNRIIEVKIAEGFLDIVSFIETGNNDQYTRAVDIFSACQKLLYKAGEWQIWWWVEALKIISQEFVENSLWQSLQPMRNNPTDSDVVFKYVTASYQKLNIVEFWRTQIESLPKINDSERCSFCISVPTSAGKTKAAELAVLRFLLDYSNEPETKCVYIAPLRALCEEVEKSFSEIFGQFSKSIVSTFYGGHEIDIFDEYLYAKTRILVVTPEKLDGMLRRNPDLKSQIRLVIADEGHLIGERDRLTYRFLLERLIYLFRKKSAVKSHKPRIILISGVLPNVEDFAELISGSRDNVVKIDWRPTEEPKFYKWIWNEQGWTSRSFDGQAWVNSFPPIAEQAQNCSSQDRFAEQVVKIAISQAKSDNAVMVFSAYRTAIGKPDFMTLLTCMAQYNPYASSETINPTLKAKYPKETLLLENCISIHHSRLPLEIRQEIDERVKSNKVRLLFASPTLAQGVNMPFDVVLVYNLLYGNSPISPSMFWNVIGRVGRPLAQIKNRSKVKAPKVIFLLNQSSGASYWDKKNSNLCSELMNKRGRYTIASPFLDFLNEIRRKSPSLDVAKLITELAEKPKLTDIIGENAFAKWDTLTLEQCLIELDRHLIALVEEADIEITLEWIQQSVNELVELFVKASVIKDDEVEYIGKVVHARLKFIAERIPKEQRRQEYLLGLPYEDCETIKQNADELLEWYQGSIGLFTNNRKNGTENLVNLMMFVMELSVCKTSRKKTRNKSKQPRQMSFGLKLDDRSTQMRRRLLTAWINGEVDDDLLSTRYEFSQYRELGRNLPWGVSAIMCYLTPIAKERGPILADLEYLPSMVKCGVNSKIACHLKRLNIPRKYAVSIADLYISKSVWDENNEAGDVFYHDSLSAIQSLQVLTNEEIHELRIDERTIEKIQEIWEQHRITDSTAEPEFPPPDIDIYK